jgi:hypothetical protein
MACLSPVGPTCLRKLDASVGASGPHDFAVRSSISRLRACDRSQASSTRPAITPHAQRCCVHRIPCPTSVTIAIRPSVGRDARTPRDVSTKQGSEIFLQRRLDRQFTDLPVGPLRRGLPGTLMVRSPPKRASRTMWPEQIEKGSFFVMAGQKREARLRARCPGHPRLSCCYAVKTWMPGTSPGMTNFAPGTDFIGRFLSETLRMRSLCAEPADVLRCCCRQEPYPDQSSKNANHGGKRCRRPRL